MVCGGRWERGSGLGTRVVYTHGRFMLIFLQTYLVFILFFKYKFIYFYWRLITLQYCISFAIHQHESTTGIHVSSHPETHLTPPSPSHPSGSCLIPGFESPASCIELALVIYITFGNIYVSMLFSEIIPPSPSPT